MESSLLLEVAAQRLDTPNAADWSKGTQFFTKILTRPFWLVCFFIAGERRLLFQEPAAVRVRGSAVVT